MENSYLSDINKNISAAIFELKNFRENIISAFQLISEDSTTKTLLSKSLTEIMQLSQQISKKTSQSVTQMICYLVNRVDNEILDPELRINLKQKIYNQEKQEFLFKGNFLSKRSYDSTFEDEPVYLVQSSPTLGITSKKETKITEDKKIELSHPENGKSKFYIEMLACLEFWEDKLLIADKNGSVFFIDPETDHPKLNLLVKLPELANSNYILKRTNYQFETYKTRPCSCLF